MSAIVDIAFGQNTSDEENNHLQNKSTDIPLPPPEIDIALKHLKDRDSKKNQDQKTIPSPEDVRAAALENAKEMILN